jgi:predicted RNA-binding protein with RPS1 domain
LAKVEDILKVGQSSKFRVIKVSPEERKLGLSLRALKEKPVEEQTIVKEKTAKASSATEKAATEQPKPKQREVKSALQQALEEHAARLKNSKQE